MPYFPVDDKLHSHRKAIKAGVSAMGLWTMCGSWSNDQGTDGFIPDYIAARFSPDYESLAARLTEVRLWEVAEQDGEKGWQFHDWTGEEAGTKRNYTKAEVDAKRRQQAERKARSRERNAVTRQNVTRDTGVTHAGQNGDSRVSHTGQSVSDRNSPRVTGGVTRDTSVSHTPPIPSHPIPSQESKNPLVAGVGELLTKQDHEKVETRSDEQGVTPLDRLPKRWCDEHSWPDDRECTACKLEHGDMAFYAKQRARGAVDADPS